MTLSNLTTNPPDQPTAICTATAPNPKDNLQTFYAPDYVYEYQANVNNNLYTNVPDGASDMPAFVTNSAMGDNMATRDVIFNTGSIFANPALTIDAPRFTSGLSLGVSSTEDVDAPAPSLFNSGYFFKGTQTTHWTNFEGNGNVTYTFTPSVPMAMLVIYFAVFNDGVRNEDVVYTTNITINHSGGTIQVPFTKNNAHMQMPYDNTNKVLQVPSAITWTATPDGNAEYAHIGQQLNIFRSNDLNSSTPGQKFLLGIYFPETNVSSITLMHNDLPPAQRYVRRRSINQMDAFPPVNIYQEIFTLPNGCVVPACVVGRFVILAQARIS